MNPTRLRQRATILRTIRRWFDDHGYLEVHTPVLVPSAGMEEHLEPVCVGPSFLHTSPEFAMKRVLAEGLCRIYQIVPCFREDERGNHHAREFTMLEWYRVGATSQDIMNEVTELIGAVAISIGQAAPQFKRVPTRSLLNDTDEPAKWFFEWVDQVEPTLTQPTIVYDYPVWQAALARQRGSVADRFEVYLSGIELANAFFEELDPEVLRLRAKQSNANRIERGKQPHPIDESFLSAVGRMPRCAGIAMGIDRLVMAMTGAMCIDEVQVSSGA